MPIVSIVDDISRRYLSAVLTRHSSEEVFTKEDTDTQDTAQIPIPEPSIPSHPIPPSRSLASPVGLVGGMLSWGGRLYHILPHAFQKRASKPPPLSPSPHETRGTPPSSRRNKNNPPQREKIKINHRLPDPWHGVRCVYINLGDHKRKVSRYRVLGIEQQRIK